MKKLIALLGFGLVSLSSISQDLHFSQISQMPLLLNPGATGMMDGMMRASVQHRNQWVGSGGKFNNTMVAFDLNMMKDKNFSKGYLGLGAFFFNDAAGDGNYGKQSGQISLSGAIPLGRGGDHVLSLGLQAGFASTSINGQNLVFESQWDGSTYDPNILSGEAIVPTYSYSDVSAGLYYSVDASNSTFSGLSKSKFTAGIALFHANKPTLRYNISSTERLPRKLVLHTSYVQDISSSRVMFSLDGSQFFQGKHTETIVGGMLGYKFNEDGSAIGAYSMMGFGLHLRSLESLIPSLMIQHKGFRFEVSYDATVSYLRKSPGAGSVEFSLVYTFFDQGLFKGGRFKN